ncbi:MAG: hypothetical protein MMC33_002699 [Icmadophila ericetorum]|nr:hypothetical protein [Icmadophila ericetorum]
MAEPEIATKAPESDATEKPKSTEPKTAEETLGMGEHCVTDQPTPSGAVPTGEISKIADIDVYITKPSDYPHSPSKLLLFLSSGTGIHSTNNQLQADHYASEGFLVVMPDQFGGDPAPNSSDPSNVLPDMASSVIEQVKLRAAETVQSFMIDMWLARQTPEKVMPILRKVVDGAKEEFADAVASGGGIYAVGYCFGGKYVLLLGSELPDGAVQPQKDVEQGMVKNEPLIKAGALAHGTMITQQDLQTLKSPVSMVCVENDQLFPNEVREFGEKYLAEKQIEHEVKIYPCVPHGFAVVGEYPSNPKIQEAQEEAFQQMVAWLKAH